jgi:hypothetical protein
MSTNWEISASEYQDIYDKWAKDYGIDFDKSVEYSEITESEYKMLEKLDNKGLVWTQHGTCEDEMLSPGLSVFGDFPLHDQKASGCGCWQSFYFHIAKVAHEGDATSWVNASAYLPCSKCNPDGENDDEDSYNSECEECEGQGFGHHYFD